jgi:hypothetical protein
MDLVSVIGEESGPISIAVAAFRQPYFSVLWGSSGYNLPTTFSAFAFRTLHKIRSILTRGIIRCQVGGTEYEF